jgi:preprotein translocase subunit SecA
MGMRHYDVQIFGGVCLFHGCISEMQTGEGKTLTATLPLVLHSLQGKGAHLATVNDYLAQRDAEWMRPIYDALGLKVGIILTDHSQDDRRRSYAADVTYGTADDATHGLTNDATHGATYDAANGSANGAAHGAACAGCAPRLRLRAWS